MSIVGSIARPNGIVDSIVGNIAADGGGITTLTNDLVSWWSLDETSGTRVDSHGSNDLTDQNTVLSTTGKQSNAASFVSANLERLIIASPTGLHFGDADFSACAWVYVDAITDNHVILGSGENTSGQVNWGLQINNATDQFKFLIPVASLTFETVEASTFGTITVDEWNFVYAAHDSANSKLLISVNDGTVDEQALTGTKQDFGTEFAIGSWGGATSPKYFDGDVDEAAVWSRLLTAAEITELYNSGNGIAYPG